MAEATGVGADGSASSAAGATGAAEDGPGACDAEAMEKQRLAAAQKTKALTGLAVRIRDTTFFLGTFSRKRFRNEQNYLRTVFELNRGS